MWLPTFATDRIVRRRPEWHAKPLATTTAAAGACRIAAVNRAGQACGIAPGMTLADARALVPDLVAVAATPAEDGHALTRLAEWCMRYTPWVAVDPTDQDGSALWLDVTGCTHLFGGEGRLLRDLEARLARFGFAARAAVADTPGAAWAWARFAALRTADDGIVPSGMHRTRIAALPVAGLRLAPDLVETLHGLGLRRIGDLYPIPRAALAARFGRLVLYRLDQALGTMPEPISPLAEPPAQRAVLAFPEPVMTAAGIAAAVQHLVENLCDTLAQQALGARRLMLSCYRSDGRIATRAIGTSAPSRDPAHLFRLFREHLDAIDPGFGLDVMALAATEVAPLAPSQASLAPASDATARELAHLVDVLGTRLGPAQVRRLAARASHIPERAVARVAAGTAPAAPAWPVGERPLRLLPHPEPIDVTAPVPDGPPMQFVWRRCTHRVARAMGPERICGEWWRDDAKPRDYYHVEDNAGRRFWVYREDLYRPDAPARWYLHGLFA